MFKIILLINYTFTNILFCVSELFFSAQELYVSFTQVLLVCIKDFHRHSALQARVSNPQVFKPGVRRPVASVCLVS